MYVCMHEHTYVYIYVCMCACIFPMSNLMSLYTYLISLNKYECHITKMSHTAIMLHVHRDPTLLHICAKTQPTASTIPTSYVIAL